MLPGMCIFCQKLQGISVLILWVIDRCNLTQFCHVQSKLGFNGYDNIMVQDGTDIATLKTGADASQKSRAAVVAESRAQNYRYRAQRELVRTASATGSNKYSPSPQSSQKGSTPVIKTRSRDFSTDHEASNKEDSFKESDDYGDYEDSDAKEISLVVGRYDNSVTQLKVNTNVHPDLEAALEPRLHIKVKTPTNQQYSTGSMVV